MPRSILLLVGKIVCMADLGSATSSAGRLTLMHGAISLGKAVMGSNNRSRDSEEVSLRLVLNENGISFTTNSQAVLGVDRLIGAGLEWVTSRIPRRTETDSPVWKADWDDMVARPRANSSNGASYAPAPHSDTDVAFERACALEDPAEALAAWEDLIRRFAASTAPEDQAFIAVAFIGKGSALAIMDRLDDAIAAWEGVVQRFHIGNKPDEILQAIAFARFLIGSALASSNRPREAIDAWDRLLQDYGESKEPITAWIATRTFALMGREHLYLNLPDMALSYTDKAIKRCGTEEQTNDLHVLTAFEVVAQSLAIKGRALLELDQSEGAINTWDEVVQRFGLRGEPEVQAAVSQSLLGQSNALTELGRLVEAIAVLDEVMRRNSADTTTASTKTIIASALVKKAALLIRSERSDEALTVWEEVIERFSQEDDPVLRDNVEFALLVRSASEIKNGEYRTAIDLISPGLERQSGEFYNRYLGYRLRARAFLGEGMTEACERDVVSILEILPRAVSINDAGAIDDIIEMAGHLNMETMREMIKASPASQLLLPVTIALETELGLEPRVGKEVEEVVEIIRRQIRQHRVHSNKGSESPTRSRYSRSLPA